MSTPEPSNLPFAREAQHRVERSLDALLHGAGHAVAPDVRPMVFESWERSQQQGVSPTLPRAPLVWSEDDVFQVRERIEWLPVALEAIHAHAGASLAAGHIVALFDAEGRMICAEGDPAAREGLAAINFRPGAQWSEGCVGTNGPGTALALGRPVHVVGAEHFCERWHEWHCAATPVHDPATGAVIAAVDISGFRGTAHPHTLALTAAIATAIEQRLVALDQHRRVLLLQRFAELSGRWPTDTLIAVDRTGALLASNRQDAAPLLRSAKVRSLLDQPRHPRSGQPTELTVALDDGQVALSRPVFDGTVLAGSCLVIQRPSRTLASHAASSVTGRPKHGHPTKYSFDDVFGVGPGIVRARSVAHAAAHNTLPVLITGESGTGKEVFAQSIHAASARAHKQFVAVNCAALSRELIESEFFGYVGGAFSGAKNEGSIGKFEAADGGTLFLDEIAELSCDAQAKLLRVLQEDEFVPVGSAKPKRIDVRIIAATNRDLAECLRSGALREDLFHRLNVLSIPLPPLRARAEDVTVLAERFLTEAMSEQGKTGLALDAEVAQAITAHDWPGNVRELKNAIRRMVALATDRLRVEDLVPQLAVTSKTAARPPLATPPSPTRTEVTAGAEAHDHSVDALLAVVAESRTMAEAAAKLGVTRSTLYRRIERHGLKPERVLRHKN